MSKRINNIFYSKLTIRKIFEAYDRASKGKKENKEVICFKMDLGKNIKEIITEIYNKKYKVGFYRKFIIYEPKKREILALPFKDRVIHQWYVEEFIKPIFVPKFIVDTYACIEKKGVHLSIRKLRKYIQLKYNKNQNFYILKCDIKKFFKNINKRILLNIIQSYVKDKDFLDLTQILLFDGTGEIGIPIGNYTSQYFANIYLNELDHYVKENLKIKYYIRYMDDFLLLLNNKEECKKIKIILENFLKKNLKLEFNKKTNYFKIIQGVNFCGYKIFKNRVLIRNQNKRRIYKRIKKWNKLYKDNKLNLKKACESFTSWEGYVKHADTENIVRKIKNRCDWLYK